MKTILAGFLVSLALLSCGQSGGSGEVQPANASGTQGETLNQGNAQQDTANKADKPAPLRERREVTPPDVTKPH